MAPKVKDFNDVLFEKDAGNGDIAPDSTVQQAGVPWAYDWRQVISVPAKTAAGLYGGYLFLVAAKWQTNLLACVIHVVSMLGLTAGTHRLWSHRSYKVKWPLQLILVIFHTIGMQLSALKWVREHRMHHKYTDTDADPHNATNGFFFSHIGWQLVHKHPEYVRKSKQLDLSDVEACPMLRFQDKYFLILMPLATYILPTLIPVYFWNESWTTAFFVILFRLTFTNNITGLVNSAAHMWGDRPYDNSITASESAPLAFVIFGEGFHNYHHTFPWDYKTAQFGSIVFNITTTFIDCFAKIGWAYDLKTASKEIIQKRVNRTGGGCYQPASSKLETKEK